MRPILFLVNDRAGLKPDQSSAELARECARRREVAVCGIRDLAVDPDGKVRARAVRMSPDGPTEEPVSIPVFESTVWVRLNPGRVKPRWAASYALETLSLARSRGAIVVNQPTGLWAAMSKLSLMSLPKAARPKSYVSPDPQRIAAWVRERKGFSVIKPTLGTHGQGVQKVSADSPDLVERIEQISASGPVIAQAFIARASEGDTRIHLVDGKPLTVDGVPCIVRRIPAEGEFRSNVSIGGSPAKAVWTDELQHIAKLCGSTLRKAGLWHVGLDVVGGKVVEVNAFSPGGLRDAGAFQGRDFTTALVDAFLEKTAR